MPLTDRVVLITGATGGLGRVVAGAFAHAGARVALVGTDVDRLHGLAGELALTDGTWMAAAGDLRNADDARAVVEDVVAAFGSVDILLHLVGGFAGGTAVVDLDPDELHAMLDQHLWTTLHAVQAAVPPMVRQGWGRVVAVSTPFALDPGARRAAYAVAKASEEVLLRSLARELSGSGVTVNVLSVRAIDAAHERELSPTPKNAAWVTPEEIAATMLFLCSDEAAPITGARIPLDGRG